MVVQSCLPPAMAAAATGPAAADTSAIAVSPTSPNSLSDSPSFFDAKVFILRTAASMTAHRQQTSLGHSGSHEHLQTTWKAPALVLRQPCKSAMCTQQRQLHLYSKADAMLSSSCGRWNGRQGSGAHAAQWSFSALSLRSLLACNCCHCRACLV